MLPRPISPDDASLSKVFSSLSDLFHSSVSSQLRNPYINNTPLPTSLHFHSLWRNALPSPPMEPPLLPTPTSQPAHGRTFRHWRVFLRSNPLRSGTFFGALIFTSLVVYTTLLSPHGPLPVWHRLPDWRHETPVTDLEHAFPSFEPTTTTETPPSPSPIPDVLTVEQIRDIVAPTRGFFTRDYSLGLGWNNVSVCGVLFDPD